MYLDLNEAILKKKSLQDVEGDYLSPSGTWGWSPGATVYQMLTFMTCRKIEGRKPTLKKGRLKLKAQRCHVT